MSRLILFSNVWLFAIYPEMCYTCQVRAQYKLEISISIFHSMSTSGTENETLNSSSVVPEAMPSDTQEKLKNYQKELKKIQEQKNINAASRKEADDLLAEINDMLA